MGFVIENGVLKDYKEELREQVGAKDAKLSEVGYKNYNK